MLGGLTPTPTPALAPTFTLAPTLTAAKACSENDLPGLMRFHLPHKRTTLSTHIDLPGSPPRMAGFYQTPPNARMTELVAKALCGRAGFAAKALAARERRRQRAPWGRHHWHQWGLRPGRERTPRVPHRFDRVPAEEGSTRMVRVQHISYSPRIRYLHQLLTPEECEHMIRVAEPRFARSPVRGSVTPNPNPAPHPNPTPHPSLSPNVNPDPSPNPHQVTRVP